MNKMISVDQRQAEFLAIELMGWQKSTGNETWWLQPIEVQGETRLCLNGYFCSEIPGANEEEFPFQTQWGDIENPLWKLWRPWSDLGQAIMLAEKLNFLHFQLTREKKIDEKPVSYECVLYNDPGMKDKITTSRASPARAIFDNVYKAATGETDAQIEQKDE